MSENIAIEQVNKEVIPYLNNKENDSDDINKKYPRFGKRGAPQAFATKLLELLSNESPDIVSWNKSGVAFQIKDNDRFTSEVLTKYFKHNNPSSFQRQLNLYGFRKVLRGPDSGSYLHPHFKRETPESIKGVRRTVQASHNTKRILKPEQGTNEIDSEYISRGNTEGNTIVNGHDLKRRRKEEIEMFPLNNPNGMNLQRNGKRPPMSMELPHAMAYSQVPINSHHHLGYPFMNMHQGANGMNHAGLGMMNSMHIAPILLPAGGHPAMGGLPMQFYYPQTNGNNNNSEGNNPASQVPGVSQSMMVPPYAHCYFGQNFANNQTNTNYNNANCNSNNTSNISQEIVSSNPMNKNENDSNSRSDSFKEKDNVENSSKGQIKYPQQFSTVSQIPMFGYNQSHALKNIVGEFGNNGGDNIMNGKNNNQGMTQEQQMQQIQMRIQAFQRMQAMQLLQQQHQLLSSSSGLYTTQQSEMTSDKEMHHNNESSNKNDEGNLLTAQTTKSSSQNERNKNVRVSSPFHSHPSMIKNEVINYPLQLPIQPVLNKGPERQVIPQHFFDHNSIQFGNAYNAPHQWNVGPAINPSNQIPVFPTGQNYEMAALNCNTGNFLNNGSSRNESQKEKMNGINKSENNNCNGSVANINQNYLEREHGSNNGGMQPHNPSEIIASANSDM